jgi:hypothetical protein
MPKTCLIGLSISTAIHIRPGQLTCRGPLAGWTHNPPVVGSSPTHPTAETLIPPQFRGPVRGPMSVIQCEFEPAGAAVVGRMLEPDLVGDGQSAPGVKPE